MGDLGLSGDSSGMQWLVTCEGFLMGCLGFHFIVENLGRLRPKMLRSPLFRDELNVAGAWLHCRQEQKEPKRDDHPDLPAEVLFFFHAGGRDLG